VLADGWAAHVRGYGRLVSAWVEPPDVRLTDQTAASALLVITSLAEELASDGDVTDQHRRHFARQIYRQARLLQRHLGALEHRRPR
jgi:hypothetical protein